MLLLQVRVDLGAMAMKEYSPFLKSRALRELHHPIVAQLSWAVKYTDCRGVRPPPIGCPRYDTKKSDGEFPVKLEFWGMRITLSLPLLPGPLWPGVVAPERAISMG